MKILILFTSLALLFSCSDDNGVLPDYNEKLRNLLRSGDMNTLQAVNEDWYYEGLNGIIFLEKDYNKVYSIFVNSDGSVDSSSLEFTSYDAFSVLFDSDINGIDVSEFEINGKNLERDKERSTAGIYKLYDKPIGYFFDSNSNYIKLDGSDQFSNVKDSLNLDKDLKLTNIVRGDTVYRETGIDLEWEGSSKANIVKIDLSHAGNFGDQVVTDSTITRVIQFHENTGSLDLLPYIKQLEVNGTFHLTVGQYEPHYIDLKNGKRILVIVRSSHSVSFNLID